MNGKTRIAVTAFFLFLLIGCAAPVAQVGIIDPQQIDEKEAKDQLIAKYIDMIVKTDRKGLEYATDICRRIQAGPITPEIVKSSPNGRYSVYLFKEKEGSGAAEGDYSVIAFHFNPLSELMRICNPDGLCNIYLKNGFTRFGRTNISAQREPIVTDTGIALKYINDRSYAFGLLFSYPASRQTEGEQLLSLFTSAFPFLLY